jgi:tetratricopeptide (TPR) repeat protein
MSKLVSLSLALILGPALGQGAGDSLERARSLIQAGRLIEAQEALQKAALEIPDAAEAHGELGLLFYQLQRYEEAVRQFGRAAQLSPDTARFSLGLAEALLGWRRYPVALEFLLAVASKFANLPEYQYNLGLAYYGVHDFPLAQAAFEKAVSLAPQLDPAHFFLGNTYAAMGALETATRHYRKALEIRPGNAAYCLALGKVLGQLGPEHDAEALRWLEKAVESKPDDVPSQFYLGLAREKAGDYRGAQALLEAVARRSPNDPAPHAALARVYYRLKDREKGDRESAIVRKLQATQSPARRPSSDLQIP